MKKLHGIAVLLTFLAFLSNHAYAQGCSDAGICTISSFKPNSIDGQTNLANQLKFGAFYGSADHAIAVYGNYVEYNRQINKKIAVDVKLTTLAQNGNGIATFGMADFFLNANYQFSEKVKLTIGTKFPLTDASKTYNNLPLPMDYQASLGTVDFILGIGYAIKKIQLVAAIQQPLTQNNNQFLASSYTSNATLRTFQSTNRFERSADVLLRVSYPMPISTKLTLTPSILPIYHLSNDKYTDEFSIKKAIAGSQGLTLNGNMYLDYKLNSKNSLQFNIGLPFIVRTARPDGLTRGFIGNVEYRIQF